MNTHDKGVRVAQNVAQSGRLIGRILEVIPDASYIPVISGVESKGGE